MEQYIPKSALVIEIEKRKNFNETLNAHSRLDECNAILSFIDTLEVKEVDNFLTPFISFKDMVNIQYPSVNDGIKAHAEIYSFNIESELFNQLTPEQQKLWRKEIEQACISGGDAGVELARDPRYKENLEVKEVDLEKLGEIARHLIAVKEHIEDMRLDKDEWSMLEKIGYPEKFKAQKVE